jgi:hypothetical protein
MEFTKFRVTNYRNVIDSDWIDVSRITAFVGQNEAGKSNLFEALYCLNPIDDSADYKVDEDWPVDQWGQRSEAKGKLVCQAIFELDVSDIHNLYCEAGVQSQSLLQSDDGNDDSTDNESSDDSDSKEIALPTSAYVSLSRHYEYATGYQVVGFPEGVLDNDKAKTWARANVPKFVYIRDYEMSGAQVELDQLKHRLEQAGGKRHNLSNDDQTILIVLDLAKIDLADFFSKGQTQDGRTTRSFDKRSASKYLTSQFASLWEQKDVEFNIEIDGPTLNIMAEDAAVGMPVRLHRRSTGFRWYVSFAWKFTHATKGDFSNCVLLLEEPGINLHFAGQRDLLKVFNRLSESNTLLYTTHLASMVDLSSPERVRIVESRDNHLAITKGVVSAQRAPMAVIEQSLGLTGDQSGLLSNRQVLIVEGGDDAIILHKLSGLLTAADKEGLSNSIYLWPAHGASKTPMYAAFAIGQDWDAGVLLDNDNAGIAAKNKINELYVSKLAEAKAQRFRVFMLGEAVKTSKTDFAIEDIFPVSFYLDCVNKTFGFAIQESDLPQDGSDMITKQVEQVIKARHGLPELDKRRVMGEMLKRFDSWTKVGDLPSGTAQNAEKLFKAINKTFASGT